MFTLFLDGNFKAFQEQTCFSNATQCTNLLVAYIKKVDVDVVVVKRNIKEKHCFLPDNQPKCGFKLPCDSFNSVSLDSYVNLPCCVKNCNFPVLLSKDNQFLISGLCHILRCLVKNKEINKKQEAVKLLGHKKFCLKAASEVSSKTHLCENLAPNVIDSNMNINFTNCRLDIPEALLQFENFLNEPVAIHNRDKRQRVVLKRLVEETMASNQPTSDLDESAAKFYRTNLNKKLAVRTNDLPPLEHIFAEGVEVTLTDLALLPLVHGYFNAFFCTPEQNYQYLKTKLQRTLLWYARVTANDRFVTAAELTSVKYVDVAKTFDKDYINENVSEENGEVLKLAETKEIPFQNLKKKELEKTLRRDLPDVLKITDQSITAPVQQFARENISLNWKDFPDQVHPAEGELSSKRASRKCSQIENIVYAVKSLCKDGDSIVDFCAGGGHVGIAVAYLLPRCSVIILDNKEESLDRARKRIDFLKLNNVSIYQCNLQNYNGYFDIGIALHACGVATDLVMHKCLKTKASFVISPCCYGKILNTPTITYPQSKLYQESNIDYESFVLLGHAGDQTSWDFEGEKPKQGKHCMELVDFDRISFAHESQYRGYVITMQPRDCSPKNNLLIGVSPSHNVELNFQRAKT